MKAIETFQTTMKQTNKQFYTSRTTKSRNQSKLCM